MKTKGCPACGTPLELPTQYLDAVAEIREQIEEFAPAIIKDYLLNQWISVKDRIPEIPDGQSGICVIVAVFDDVYEKINPGHGYEVYEANFYKGQFETLADGEWFPIVDEVTHWMFLPNPPVGMPVGK